MIQEILQIQNTHQHLSYDERSLIDREEKALQVMTTRSLTAYLYGAQMLVKSAKDHIRTTIQEIIQNYFQPRLQPVNDQTNRLPTTNIF
jgi:predicted SpoU family rRNA methylase